jgi:hypothetical protein
MRTIEGNAFSDTSDEGIEVGREVRLVGRGGHPPAAIGDPGLAAAFKHGHRVEQASGAGRMPTARPG